MTLELGQVDYVAQITRYQTHDELLPLWQAILAKDTPGWQPGRALEYLVLRAFQLEGAEVSWPFTIKNDGEDLEQIDGVLYIDGLACLMECKDLQKRLTVEPIAKLRNQLLRRPGTTIGLLFSTSGFTEPAKELARFVAPQTILLWQGREIAYCLEQQSFRLGLKLKYRWCVERAVPFYDLHTQGEDLP
jgi:hypothetical protein